MVPREQDLIDYFPPFLFWMRAFLIQVCTFRGRGSWICLLEKDEQIKRDFPRDLFC